MVTIQKIIEKARLYIPDLDEARILRAFEFADSAHSEQKRFSGEPYIIHPLSVTDILLDYHPDENTIIGSLLHDVAEDTPVTLDDIRGAFGDDVYSLCESMMKLSKVRSKLNDPQVENLRKLFLAMAKDFRVVLIKLCDRLHNMKTLEHVRPDKQTRIAQETLYIYAPIASRLGIYRIKDELENLCFSYLATATYNDIQEQLSKTDKWRDQYIETTKKMLAELFSREGINALIDGRVKSPYSIFRKMQKKNKNSISDIFDLYAIRVILPDISKHDLPYVGHLYTTLGILHNHFTPLTNRFKDYVAVPKVKGYRSLHTTIMGLGPKSYAQPTEVQIRTDTMHQEAEYGIAAHWIYETRGVIPRSDELKSQSGKNLNLKGMDGQILQRSFRLHHEWISSIDEIGREITSNQELLDSLKTDVFQDRIFVLTPRGDVKDLPKGATPVDLAYAVHTDIGNHCMAARVNGSVVTLDYQLHSGEVVEITTRKNATPSQHWLSFVKTNHARNRVRAWFRSLDGDMHLRLGRKIMNDKLKQWGKPALDVSLGILRKFDGRNLPLKERRELLCEIGRGAILPSVVIRKIYSLEELLDSSLEHQQNDRKRKEGLALEKPKLLNEGLEIAGNLNVPYHFVQCCDAKDAVDLIGYITRGRGVSVHKKNCTVIRNSDAARLVPVIKPRNDQFEVKLCVETHDRIGMLRDVATVFTNNSINIQKVSNSKEANGYSHLDYVINIYDIAQLEDIMTQIEKIPNVLRAFKVN